MGDDRRDQEQLVSSLGPKWNFLIREVSYKNWQLAKVLLFNHKNGWICWYVLLAERQGAAGMATNIKSNSN